MFIKSEDKKEHFNKILLIRQKITIKDFLICIFYRIVFHTLLFFNTLPCDYKYFSLQNKPPVK